MYHDPESVLCMDYVSRSLRSCMLDTTVLVSSLFAKGDVFFRDHTGNAHGYIAAL